MRLCHGILLLLLCCTASELTSAQVGQPGESFSGKLLEQVSKKAGRIEAKLSRQTSRYLASLQRQEEKLRSKLQRKDSVAAKEIFGDIAKRYENISKAGTGKSNWRQY